MRSLRRDSVSTASDGEGNKNLICKSCGDTYARCTCIKCVECGGMLVNNVGGWPGKDGTGKLIGVLRLDFGFDRGFEIVFGFDRVLRLGLIGF